MRLQAIPEGTIKHHVISKIAGRKRSCVLCSLEKRKTPKGYAIETSFMCKFCDVPLCKKLCFSKYHELGMNINEYCGLLKLNRAVNPFFFQFMCCKLDLGLNNKCVWFLLSVCSYLVAKKTRKELICKLSLWFLKMLMKPCFGLNINKCKET